MERVDDAIATALSLKAVSFSSGVSWVSGFTARPATPLGSMTTPRPFGRFTASSSAVLRSLALNGRSAGDEE